MSVARAFDFTGYARHRTRFVPDDVEAALRLLAFDVTAGAPSPVETALPLGFPSKGNEKTVLTDLIAADGRLYALVTRSDRLWVRDPRWQSQVVVALGEAGGR
jgi:hypothetical protein